MLVDLTLLITAIYMYVIIRKVRILIFLYLSATLIMEGCTFLCSWNPSKESHYSYRNLSLDINIFINWRNECNLGERYQTSLYPANYLQRDSMYGYRGKEYSYYENLERPYLRQALSLNRSLDYAGYNPISRVLGSFSILLTATARLNTFIHSFWYSCRNCANRWHIKASV